MSNEFNSLKGREAREWNKLKILLLFSMRLKDSYSSPVLPASRIDFHSFFPIKTFHHVVVSLCVHKRRDVRVCVVLTKKKKSSLCASLLCWNVGMYSEVPRISSTEMGEQEERDEKKR